jgi:phosphatidylglycerol:prolipoprotein diacylglycerol transferase
MHPVIVRLGPVVVSSYGLFLGLSFLLGLWLASARARRMGLDRRLVVDAAFWIVLSAMACSRLYYVVQHFGDFSSRPLSIFFPGQGRLNCLGGVSMYGGIIGGILAEIVFFAAKKIPILPYADALAPSVGLGIFLTRIGCFLNGCCFGLPTTTWLGVHFPLDSPAGRYELAVHAPRLLPSELFLSASGLVVLAGTLLVKSPKAPPGTAFCVMGLLSTALSFALDFTRFYPPLERFGPLTHTQATTLILFLIFLGLLIRTRFRTGKDGAAQVRVEEK